MGRSVVVDASFAFKLLLPNPLQKPCRAAAEEWHAQGRPLCAPALWVYELTSALCKTVYFGQIAPAERREALRLALRLGVHLFPPDTTQVELAVEWTTRLKRAAAYDCFYLALAETLQCELWTTDAHLRQAAGVDWVRTP